VETQIALDEARGEMAATAEHLTAAEMRMGDAVGAAVAARDGMYNIYIYIYIYIIYIYIYIYIHIYIYIYTHIYIYIYIERES